MMLSLGHLDFYKKHSGVGRVSVFFFQAEDGIRDFCLSRGLGDVYKRQWDKGNRSDTLKQKIQKKKYISDETKPAE